MATLDRKEGTLGRSLAAHLLRRACYQISSDRISEFAAYNVEEAVDLLLQNTDDVHPLPLDPDSGIFVLDPDLDVKRAIKIDGIRNWWLSNAISDTTSGAKMQFFLHTCFTAALRRLTPTPTVLYEHWKLISLYRFGNYKEFAFKMSIDWFMSQFLNNNENTVEEPNENYAREILELFTIGKGPIRDIGDFTHYTEHDIVQAAKVLTGWRTKTNNSAIDVETGLRQATPSVANHDTSDKVFSHAFNFREIKGRDTVEGMYEELQELIDMIFDQDETARFVMRKMYRYFVASEITEEVEQDIIEPLASIFRDNNYELSIPIRTLFESKHFYDEGNNNDEDTIIGGLVKNPIEYTLGFMSYFKMALPSHSSQDADSRKRNSIFLNSLDIVLAFMGMNVFGPETVAGYPAYFQEPLYDKNWINSQTIISRYKFGEMMISSKVLLTEDFFASVVLNMQNYTFNNTQNSRTPFLLLRELLEDLLPAPADEVRLRQINDLFLGLLSVSDYIQEYDKVLAGESSEDLKIALNNIPFYLTQMPEYQLM